MIGPDQITVPVRFGTVVRDFGPNYIWSGPWSDFLVRSYLVRSVVRRFGPKLFGPVRGPAFRSENSLVRSVSEALVRNFRTGPKWSGPVRIFPETVFSRTGPVTDRLIWSETGPVRTFSLNFEFLIFSA